MRKSGLTGTTSFYAFLDNTGTVLVLSGTLAFHRGGGLTGGIYEAAAGANIHFVEGSFTVNGAVDWRGPGEVRIVGGSIELLNVMAPLDV